MSQTAWIASLPWKFLIGDVWSQNYFYDDWVKSRGNYLFENFEIPIFNFPRKLSSFVLDLPVTYVIYTITVSKSLRKPGSVKKVYLENTVM